jgi:hypothetical protein
MLESQAGDPLDALQGALDIPPLAVLGEPVVGHVRVAVVAELVARTEDGLDRARIAVDGQAGDEEAAAHAGAVEHAQDPRHAHLRPVGLVPHRREPGGVGGIDRQDGRLRIDIECERQRRAVIAGPGEPRHVTSLTHRCDGHKGATLQRCTIAVRGSSNADARV